MALSNRVILYNRTREAARKLYLAIEEAKACAEEYDGNGGAPYILPFFYEEENVNGTLRTDLDVTVAQFGEAQAALHTLAANRFVQTINIGDHLPFLSHVK